MVASRLAGTLIESAISVPKYFSRHFLESRTNCVNHVFHNYMTVERRGAALKKIPCVPSEGLRIYAACYEDIWDGPNKNHFRRSYSTTEERPTKNQQASLLAWLQENGARINGVSLAKSQYGGLSLVSRKRVEEGEELIYLPTKTLLFLATKVDARNSTNAGREATLQALVSTLPANVWPLRLGLRLLSEKAHLERSFWAPYISCLPPAIHLPMFFSEEELRILSHEPVKGQALMRRSFVQQFVSRAVPALLSKLPRGQDPFLGKDVNFEVAGLAMATASSRAFKGPGGDYFFAPLIDMADHSFSPSARIVTSLTSAGGTDATLVALRDLQEGEPVEISYGDLGNDELALDYGFAVPENPHDSTSTHFHLLMQTALQFALSNQIPALFMHKEQGSELWRKKLEELRFSGEEGDMMVSMNSDFCDNRTRAALRAFFSSPEELSGLSSESLHKPLLEVPLGAVVERRVCLILSAIFWKMMNSIYKLIAERETQNRANMTNIRSAVSLRDEFLLYRLNWLSGINERLEKTIFRLLKEDKDCNWDLVNKELSWWNSEETRGA